MGWEVLGAEASSSRNNTLPTLAEVGTLGRGLRPRLVLGRGGLGESSLSELIMITLNGVDVETVFNAGLSMEGFLGFSNVVSSVSDMSEEWERSVTIHRAGRPGVGFLPTLGVGTIVVGFVGDDPHVV